MIDEQEILVLCAIAARCFGVFVCLPFGDSMQAVPRLCVSMAWGWAIFGTVPVAGDISALSCLWEFAVGALLAAPLRLLSDSAELFGELLDTARGQTISSVIDPLGGQGASDLAAVCRAAVVGVAVHMGALELAVRELAGSYALFPLGAPWQGVQHAQDLFRWCLSILTAVLGTSSLWLAAFLMVDLVVIAAARMVKGLQFSLAGSLVKGFLTFSMLAIVMELARQLPPFALAGPESFLSWHEVDTSGSASQAPRQAAAGVK